MAPSEEALQEMLNTCNEYANNHNLKFSTNPIPAKSKTKCLAFMSKKTELKKLRLGDDLLPWVEKGKHLGNTLENISNGMRLDMNIKRAQYIGKNNEIQQEFYFAHSETKFKINRIYNSHFTGSPLWDLFCNEAKKVENSWSVSFRLMYDLPRNTHRYFVEPISGMPHIKSTLIKNFLGFVNQVENSSKSVAKDLLSHIKYDVRSTTGSNLRNILLLTDKDSIEELTAIDSRSLTFSKIPDNNEWRIPFLRELLEIRSGNCILEQFNQEEISDFINFICIS